MSKSDIPCVTSSCVEAIEKHGEMYHRTCDPYKEEDREKGIIALCQNCGGILDGEVWKHECKTCHKEVPAGELTGLFIPHSCKECHDALVAEQLRMGHVCGRCRQVFAWCCC